MSYSVSCACGVTHAVSATQAGSRIACACGRSLDVPTLSSLRKSAGESPFPLSTVERIQAMIRDGSLPSGDVCPYSGRAANDTVFFHVQCERAWERGGDSRQIAEIILYFLLCGWVGALFVAARSKPAKQMVFGRNTLLEVPLRISSDVRKKVLGIRGQKKLRALLCHTPIYSELLREFPDATVAPIKIA